MLTRTQIRARTHAEYQGRRCGGCVCGGGGGGRGEWGGGRGDSVKTRQCCCFAVKVTVC